VLPQLHRLAAVRADVPEPIARSSSSVAGAESASTPISTNAKPSSGALAGSRSSSTSSERIASTAMRSGSAWRKTSLNTSSESGPR
jgi:hypothetical protein